jgi:murein DD-endopeptidase MepM/ murein hydrolase activator NlpD
MRQSVLILLFCLLFFPAPAGAEKLYKFVDENGRVTFTDKAVGAGRLESVTQVRKERPLQRFSVQNRGSKSAPILYAVNGYFGPIEAEFHLKELKNMSVKRHTPRRALVPAAGELRVISMHQKNNRRGYSYAWESRSVLGDPQAEHTPTQPYLLPVPADKEFYISQAFLGEATHASHVQSEYAVDFPMPIGTAIHAVRSGIVMDVSGDFFEGGASEKMLDQANYVRVLHDDGTMAVYAHLELETVRYPIGKRIERGQVLAFSGNTGFSTGPHLHFVIQKNFGMELRSIPFIFEGPEKAPFTPEAGTYVYRQAG